MYTNVCGDIYKSAYLFLLNGRVIGTLPALDL